jgi:hypothetical protein
LDGISQGCGGRNRTCDMTLNRRPPVPAQAPPQEKVRTAGFEPAISCARGTRNTRLSYVLIGRPCKSQKLGELRDHGSPSSGLGGNRTRKFQMDCLVLYLRAVFVSSCRWARSPERPAGVEPALLPWQSSRLPLHHGRNGCVEFSKSRWRRTDAARRRLVLVSGTRRT